MKKITILFFIIISLLSVPISTANANPKSKHRSELAAELRCMGLNLYHEARGEPKAGILAVGHVTLNRVMSRNYPNTICQVVYQRFQFSWVHTKKEATKTKVPKHIREIAYKLVVLQKYKDNTKGSLFFHNHTVNPAWGKKPTVVIGGHIFYR